MRKSAVKNRCAERRGVALIVVLLVIMVITVTSLGFLSKSDVELACGVNLGLRTEMDYAADSGLQLARGFIMSPQDISSEYWTGDLAQQIAAGDDYFDVAVVRDDSDPTDRGNYIIDCNAYRLRNGEKIGRSNITAKLRLDCIAMWSGANTIVSPRLTINGDLYAAGNVTGSGAVGGDVFAGGAVTGLTIEGRTNQSVAQPPVVWPPIDVSDYSSTYYFGAGTYSPAIISAYVHPAGAFNPSAGNPGGVRYRAGDVELPGNVNINGMIVVTGDLILSGSNTITAVKNFPALLVGGDVIMGPDAQLQINGLAVVEGQLQISLDNADLDIVGGLFTGGGIVETVADSSGNANTGRPYGDPQWRPSGGQTAGALEFDGVNDTLEEPGAGAYINGLAAVTVSMWVKSDITGQDRGIMFSRDPTISDAYLGIRYDETGVFGGGISVIKVSIRATSGFTQIESTSNVQTTDWQHLAIVWESGSSLKLYINGALNPLTFDMGAVSGIITDVDKLMLGRGTKGMYWDGLIDDLRVYNYALDPNDVYPPVDGLGGLLTHWRLDDSGCDVEITAAPCKTAIMTWSAPGAAEKWEQVAGAFFKSIDRRSN